MTDRQRPGHGSKPGFEDQATQTAFGKPGQVPGEPGGPNALGQGESGPSEQLQTRRATEEAARTGRFPDGTGTLRDDSAPVEPEAPADDDIRAAIPPR